jgi:catechol 2,3-dioxygenase-like lactoylglutathione lyase family enzyme
VPASVEIERGADIARSAPVELHVPDFAPAKRFYGALGFTVAREESGNDDGYLVMVHGADILRFWPGSSSALRRGHFARDPITSGHGAEIVLTFDDLDAAFTQATSIVTTVEPIQLRHWGLRDFRVLDPYGFYVRCTEAHDPLTDRSVTSPAVPSR